MGTSEMADDAFSLPPEIAGEAQSIKMRQAIMQAMLQKAMQGPQAPEVKGRFQGSISPLAALTSVGTGALAANGLNNANAEYSALGNKYQQGVADALLKMQTGMSGRPSAVDPQEVQQSQDQGSPLPEAIPASQDQKRKAVMDAMMNPYTRTSPIVKAQYEHLLKADDPRTVAPGATLVGPDNQPIFTAPDHGKNEPAPTVTQIIDPKNPKRVLNIDARTYKGGTLGDVGVLGESQKPSPSAVVHNPPAVTTAEVIDPNDPTRLLKVDARTYKGGTLGAPGVVGVSGKVGDERKLNMKREFNMQGIGQVIQDAEDLLTGKNGNALPTQSGVGTAVDYAASIVGVSPSGAKEADKLKALGGALTSKMPRMEGPQSDRDVVLYKEMAARVGDGTIPVERRKAALETVKELWGKYERLNPAAFADRRAPSNTLRFDASGNPVP